MTKFFQSSRPKDLIGKLYNRVVKYMKKIFVKTKEKQHSNVTLSCYGSDICK